MILKELFYTSSGVAKAIILGDSGVEYCSNLDIINDNYWCSCDSYVYNSERIVVCKHLRYLYKMVDKKKMKDKTDELIKTPTGCKTVDNLLGGGFPHKLISALFGDPATGKSFLAYQSGVNNVKINNKKTLLLDTEGLTQNDLDTILGKLGKRYDVDEKKLKDKFQMIKTYNDPQMQSIQKLMQMFGYMVTFEMSKKGGKYKVIFRHCDETLTEKELKQTSMIIIDSLTKPIKDSIGSETPNLPARAQIVERLFGKLHQVADLYNIAVVVIHHQSNAPPVGPYKMPPRIYGGNPIYYNSKYILEIFQSTKNERDMVCAENKKNVWGKEARRVTMIRHPSIQPPDGKFPIRLMKDMGFVDS